ncbi:aminotransferase class V-fold PLP-dependent enzyme [Sinimarinibacterium sp. CAU 1509]|uniref:aminotransferase class V-fold PLP-dependent enzyme n=1 Tax=Sinimarinibacterium sp. CAU 1509 TaxID=2562283 RepID=UPI0010AD1179|nr:aminotransferase class V-fold PLP-dependent enzyme [Sinimarinibacterium sp. CAU 1509]TJY61931.1 aminotransferase class V-fold PLP-dependent enzyme [Sinimarinibacterium sp. CAU 1509]
MPSALDLGFVRAQFPAFSETSLRDGVFLENAGGSYACAPVLERLQQYYRRLKVQPYYPYPASSEAGAWMDAAHEALARYLNVATDEVQFGPSTSQNTYVLAQAFSELLHAGDEIIVTNQDHEANSGVWRRLGARGIVIREWSVDRGTGALDPGQLETLIGERTRLLVFPHCSNIVAQINPVATITARARAAGVISVVDGVSYAPHGLPDVSALGADIYLFSLYKTFGPHQGLMVVRRAVMDQLGNQGHYFNASQPRKRLVPAGPDHAQVAASRGIAEYFDALDAHHGGGDDAGRPARVRALLSGAERPLVQQLLDALSARHDLRVLGPSEATKRAATIAIVPHPDAEPMAIVRSLASEGVMAAAGHFYSVRLLEAIGIDPARGVVRLSLAHYNSSSDIERALAALEQALA